MKQIGCEGEQWAGRLRTLAALPDGIVTRREDSYHKISVTKEDGELQLRFFDEVSGEVQARLIPDDPRHLVSPYTQAMMLGLAWNPEPERIYVIGLGGGRVPMVLRALCPRLRVDCSETDSDVLEVAREYFGVVVDARLRVHLKDGRKYLKELEQVRFDLIMVDAFDGTGVSPFPLSTKEFYKECKEHLAEAGVVVVNVLLADPQYREKIRTLVSCFRQVLTVSTGNWGSSVLFATPSASLTVPEIVDRAIQLEASLGLRFPLAQHARRLAPVFDAEETSGVQLAVLSDASPPTPIPLRGEYFRGIGRNEQCPCGSGKKYKKCHGRG